MRRLILGLLILLAFHESLAQCGNCETANDVVFNGDFEAGNFGFTSDHQYVPAPSVLCPLCPEDRYAIGINAQDYHNQFTGLDHTNPGIGNFMICNGDSLTQVEVWCQTVNVSPTTFYTFAFWAINITDNAEPHPYAQLQIRINGVTLPDVYEIDGDWEQFSAPWYSGNNTQLTLCILNQQSSGGGNDFGIDDISFYTCLPILPAAPAQLGENQIVCGGDIIEIGMTPSGNYNYEWTGLPDTLDTNNPHQQIAFQNSTADTMDYQFVLQVDTAGICITSDSISISVIPFEPLDISTEILVCPYDSAQVEVPNIYDEIIWSDGNNATTRFLSPGNYSLFVSDNFCNDLINITVANPEDPHLSLGNDISGCSNAGAILQSEYIGLWSDGSLNDSIWIYNSGQYSFTTTINSCEYSDTIMVELFPVPMLELGNDTLLCEGQTLLLTAGNEWDFVAWSNGAGGPSIIVSDSGEYMITALIANCIARDTITLSSIDSITLNFGDDILLCEGDQYTIQTEAAGLWNDGVFSNSLIISSAGVYSFIYSPEQCAQSDSIEVSVLNVPNLTLGNDTSICAGEMITLTVGDGWENIVWNNGSQQPQILAGAGIVSVTTSIGNCSASDQIFIFPISPIELDLGADTTLCEGEALILSAGAAGLWNSTITANEFIVTQPGTYTFEYGNEGCLQSDEIIVEFEARPEYLYPNDTILCRSDTIYLTAGNGWNEVLWNDSIADNSLAAIAGTYILWATTGACSISDTITINAINSPHIELGNDTTLCENSMLSIQTEIPGIWNGTTPSSTINIATAGEYVFQYTDGLCSFADTIEVSYIQLPTLLPFADTTICPWDSFTLEITSWPGTITWANGSTSLDELMTVGGNTVTGQWNGCDVTETFTLSHYPIEILATIADTLVCSNPGLSIEFDTPVEWSNGTIDNTILITIDGQYSYYLNAFGCIQSDTFSVNVQLSPETGLTPEIALCGDEVIVQTLVSGEWSDGQTGTTAIFSETGSYSFTLDDTVCHNNYPVQIYPATFPTIILEENVSFCEDNKVEIEATLEDATNYAWTDTMVGLTREISKPGVYILTAQNECGVVADSIKADVFPCNFGLFIPSSFTPNEDNINEGWQVQGFNLKEIDIKVYNRFGDIVFSTTDMATIWNPGLGVGDDIYNYRITATTYDGKALREYGRIYLLR